jgi:hypothetical protein
VRNSVDTGNRLSHESFRLLDNAFRKGGHGVTMNHTEGDGWNESRWIPWETTGQLGG